jgi:hypothetical protein
MMGRYRSNSLDDIGVVLLFNSHPGFLGHSRAGIVKFGSRRSCCTIDTESRTTINDGPGPIAEIVNNPL